MDKVKSRQGLRNFILAVPGGRTLLRFREKFRAHRWFKEKGNAKEVFAKHYKNNAWGDEESVSGPGSTIRYTENIRRNIPILVQDMGFRSILDAPCGDYNWFRKIVWSSKIDYTGGDIVEPLIKSNSNLYQSEYTNFITLDIINDALPKADLWLCRDCFFHLSEHDIFLALEKFLGSEINYILTTTFPNHNMNSDIPIGSFRKLNFQLPPFNFGEPLREIDDSTEGYAVRYLALWDNESIKKALIKNKTYQRIVGKND